MKLKEAESEFYIIKEGGLSLSGKNLAELIQAVIAKGNPFRLKVKGFSMSPFIKDGDTITISPLSRCHKTAAFKLRMKAGRDSVPEGTPGFNPGGTPFRSSIGFGQPVAFIQPETGRLVIHRVVGKSGNYYLIKGDNIVNSDGLISKENILGCVTSVERNGKKLFPGLSPERFLIAFLSRWSLLFPLLLFLRRFMRPVIKRFKHE